MTPTTRLDPLELGTVLGAWAHPDDETFLSAGITARITDAGGAVACLTATRGEEGSPDPVAWPPGRLGRRRERELRAALSVVGVTDVHVLDHHDGTLDRVAVDDGAREVLDVMDAVAPDTVLTFGPDGLTGHPDHVAISRWATRACEWWGRPVRLLYATTTPEFARRWAALHREINAFPPGLPLPTPLDRLALDVDVAGDELDRKLVSLSAHASQVRGLVDAIGEDTLRDWIAAETFRLAAVRAPA